MRVAGVVVERDAAFDLVHGAVAQHLRERGEDLIAVSSLASRGGRMIGRTAGAAERLVEVVLLPPRVPVHLRRQLHVEPHHRLALTVQRCLVDVEARKGARERDGSRLTLDFVVREEVSTVADDRPAKRAAHLLVRVGDDTLLDEIGGVEAIVPEETR